MRNITRQEWYGALIAVLVLAVLLSFASPYFLSTRNLSNILVQASVVALLAGGQTFVILTGGVDLAVGALTALCGAYAGYMMVKLGIDPSLAILAALAIGAAIGIFNGYLVAYVGIPAFIVTLGGHGAVLHRQFGDLLAVEEGRSCLKLRLLGDLADVNEPWRRPLVLQVAAKWDPMRIATMTRPSSSRKTTKQATLKTCSDFSRRSSKFQAPMSTTTSTWHGLCTQCSCRGSSCSHERSTA